MGNARTEYSRSACILQRVIEQFMIIKLTKSQPEAGFIVVTSAREEERKANAL